MVVAVSDLGRCEKNLAVFAFVDSTVKINHLIDGISVYKKI